MPFGETREGGPGNPAGSEAETIREKIERRRQKEEEEEKQRAYTFLRKSGRAKTPEEAEHYLESLNQLKEKLILFALEQTDDPDIVEAGKYNLDQYPTILYGRERATKSQLEKITPESIDRSNPELWDLSTRVKPHYSHYLDTHRNYASGERLSIKLSPTAGFVVTIVPDFSGEGETGSKLQKHLSKDEMEFLGQEFTFALKDLEKELRDLADEVAVQRGFGHPGWQTLSLNGETVENT